LDFLTGPVGVVHFLDEHLLANPVNLLVFFNKLLVQPGDLLFQKCRLTGKFCDGNVLALKLVRYQHDLGFGLVQFVLDIGPLLLFLFDLFLQIPVLLPEFI
jgi:hypothetical protein